MRVIKSERKHCISCMETHDVLTVEIDEAVHLPGKPELVRYKAQYDHCPTTDEFWADERQMQHNHFALLDAQIDKIKED